LTSSPFQIICSRLPEGAEKTKLTKEIEELLEEKFFVPVLRSSDASVQAQIGKPFSPSNMPKFVQDPMSPTMEIKAYAGPMTYEQAQTFHKRLKTPPRLTPTTAPSSLNLSFSPKSSAMSSPFRSPRMSKSLTEIVSSTPKHKKKLFEGSGDDMEDEELYLDNINGNHRQVNGILNEKEEEEFKEILEDLMEEKMRMDREKISIFRGYRNPEPLLETPIRGRKNDTNSNHLNLNYNSGDNRPLGSSNDSMFCNVRSESSAALMTYLDESGSVYNSDNVCDSPSFIEKHIRLTDTNKGLEKIGREIALENNIGWKEYWSFLGRFLDIRSEEGLQCFESFLKQREKLKTPEEEKKSLNDSFGLGAICAGFNSLDLNGDAHKTTRNGLTSPSTSISRSSLVDTFAAKNVLPLSNPYSCLEQSCRTFSKRLLTMLESETVQDQHSYEKILLQEANKLNTTIDSYKRDSRFSVVNCQKVHARYCFLLVSQLKKHSNDVKYLRTFTPLISKVYALASQYASQDLAKSHAVCLSRFVSSCIEKQEKIFSADSVDTETACVDAWNGPDIVECSCLFDVNLTSVKHRREIRKKLYNGELNGEKSLDSLTMISPAEKSTRPTVDVWARRIPQDDEDLYLSCSDSDSDDEKFFTPPSSPSRFFSDDDDDMNEFEESLENFEDEKDFQLFIEG
jgi:ankyrin repeat and LEM domain-containing protein 2